MTDKDLNELQHYKKIYATDDLATRAYSAIAKMMGQQVEVMNDFDLKAKIKMDKKDSADYERVINMYESMPKMITALHQLKNELGIEYVEKTTTELPVSPQSIFKQLNGTR